MGKNGTTTLHLFVSIIWPEILIPEYLQSETGHFQNKNQLTQQCTI